MRNRFLLLALLGLTTLAVSQASLDKLKPLKLKLPELPIFCEEPAAPGAGPCDTCTCVDDAAGGLELSDPAFDGDCTCDDAALVVDDACLEVNPCDTCTCVDDAAGGLELSDPAFDGDCTCDDAALVVDDACLVVDTPVEDTCPCDPEALNWLEYAQCLIDAALISIKDWPTCAGLLGDELEECETTCEGDEELSPEAYVECIKEFIEGLGDLSILDKKKEVIKGATSKLTGAKDKLTGAASLLQRFEIPPLPKCDLELIQDDGDDEDDDQVDYSACLEDCDIAIDSIEEFYGCVGGFNIGAPYIVPPCPEILGEISEEALLFCQTECEGNTATLSTEEYFDCIKEIFDEISVRDIFG